MTGGQGDEWAQVASMGIVLEPGNSLYAGGKAKTDTFYGASLGSPTQPLEDLDPDALLGNSLSKDMLEAISIIDINSHDEVEGLVLRRRQRNKLNLLLILVWILILVWMIILRRKSRSRPSMPHCLKQRFQSLILVRLTLTLVMGSWMQNHQILLIWCLSSMSLTLTSCNRWTLMCRTQNLVILILIWLQRCLLLLTRFPCLTVRWILSHSGCCQKPPQHLSLIFLVLVWISLLMHHPSRLLPRLWSLLLRLMRKWQPNWISQLHTMKSATRKVRVSYWMRYLKVVPLIKKNGPVPC